VVANVTATSDELIGAMRERVEREPASFTLIIPAPGGREAGERTLAEALERLRTAGLNVAGSVGNADPILAVTDVWDPKKYDEIIVSTLPMRFSKWMSAGLPQRISRVTGAPVTHVVAQPAKAPVETTAPPARNESSAAMGPLAVLAWGGQKHR
ncbi:MAG: hypothetical protein ACHQCG_07345, partial [Solirubrobacterales bacterium]